MDALNGRRPIKAVTPKSIGRVAELIGATLGLQERKRAAAGPSVPSADDSGR